MKTANNEYLKNKNLNKIKKKTSVHKYFDKYSK